jgi:hypothetical protein
MKAGARVRGVSGRKAVVDRAPVEGAPALLVVVCGQALPGRIPSPSRIASSCGPNESVTPASNQQIIPGSGAAVAGQAREDLVEHCVGDAAVADRHDAVLPST